MAEEEPFEVLDLEAIRRGNSWLQSLLGDISRQSAAKQVVIGGASGWISGYLFVKVGKIAAATLGTTILLVQIAQYKGYIQINWKKVQKEMNLAKNQMSKEISKKYPHFSQNIAQHHGYLQINWSKLEREAHRAKRELQREAYRNSNMLQKTQLFFKQNIFLAGGFAGGFLIGMAF